jgi:hypothetical protein
MTGVGASAAAVSLRVLQREGRSNLVADHGIVTAPGKSALRTRALDEKNPEAEP